MGGAHPVHVVTETGVRALVPPRGERARAQRSSGQHPCS